MSAKIVEHPGNQRTSLWRQLRAVRGQILAGALLGVLAFFAFEMTNNGSAQADVTPPEPQVTARAAETLEARRAFETPEYAPRRAYSGLVYRNCTAARAAGAAPVYRDEPGYGEHLDRDGDGIGCEPYPH